VQDIAQLTAREREIALLVAEGRGNREIAEAVYLSEATVKSHILRITAKLDAPNRVGIAVTVALAGLLV
jgi:DNA-binding CsgD family transcriptional regulator